MSLLVLGTVAFDSIETPFGKAERIIGGAGTYICWSASQFYNNIKLVSVIGDDFPQAELDALAARGVDLSGVEKRIGEKSFYWAGKYHLDMNSRDTLVTELNVLADFSPKLPENYKNPEMLLLGNFAPAIQMQVLDQLNERPKLVAMDTMNFWMDIAMDDLKKVIKQVDVLIINDEEARQLSGNHSLVKAAKTIREMGPKYLVIKKGEHGALIFHDEHIFFAPALPLADVYDPTGAGDTFAGGFAGFITQQGNISFETMKTAIIQGSNLASFCVEKFGTERMLTLTKQEVNERLKQFKALTQFEIELS
jgi:sugar/nucleoside kinase (ribokinase family)